MRYSNRNEARDFISFLHFSDQRHHHLFKLRMSHSIQERTNDIIHWVEQKKIIIIRIPNTEDVA